MVLLRKDDAAAMRSAIKARRQLEINSIKHEKFLSDIAEEEGDGSIIFIIRKRIRIFSTTDIFEYGMTVIILANSILFAISDYSHVNSYGELMSEDSTSNMIVQVADPVFLSIFFLEMILKMIGFGFFGKGGYFRDYWCWLDFITVIIGLLSLLPNVPNLNVIRTLRCFRVLKTLKSFPALKSVTTQVVSALPKLTETLAIYLFSVFFFAVIGLYIFLGPQLHSRCRYTPFPVTLDYQIGWSNYSDYRCLNSPNVDLSMDEPSFEKSTSPWRNPLNCWWPVDNSNPDIHRFCAFIDKDTMDANNYCSSSSVLPIQDQRWCGSNYDAFGNFRFTDRSLSWAESYFSDILFGYATFDNIFRALVSIFIVSTGNSWSLVMQTCGDSVSKYSPLFFITVLIIINFMLLSLMIATWETAVEVENAAKIPNYFEYSVRGVSIEDAEMMKEQTNEGSRDPVTTDSQLEGYEKSSNGEVLNPAKRTVLQTYSATDISSYVSQLGSPYASYSQLFIDNDVDGDWLFRLNEDEIVMLLNEIGISKTLHQKKIMLSFRKLLVEKITNQDVVKEPSVWDKIMKWHYPPAKRLSTNFWFELVVVFMCVATLLCAVSDSYPESSEQENRLGMANFVIVMFFLFEISTKILGYGIVRFTTDAFLMMDSVLVILSIVDALSAIPVAFCVKERCTPRNLVQYPNSSSGQISPIRGLRCIRILFLLRYLPGVRVLISRIAKAIQSTMIFFILIFIFLYMMALVGTSLYANRFRFDQNGQVIVEINSYEWVNSQDRPRNNFDDFLRSCATVMQLLTMDNWTDVMSSIWRSQGPLDILYPVVVIIVGSYMLLSLYLGKLVEDFTSTAEEVAESMKELDSKIPAPEGSEILVANNNDAESAKTKENNDIEEGSTIQNEASVTNKKLYYVPYLTDFVSDKRFEYMTFAAVAISILTIILDNPLADPNLSFKKNIVVAGDAITFIFAAEAVLKILGLGPYTYFTDPWLIFDFLVACSSLYGLFSSDAGVQAMRSLRVIRVVRAIKSLRLLTFLKGLRVLIDTVSSSAQEIINVSIFLILIWAVFASLAIQYLKGQFRECGGEPMLLVSSNATFMHILQYPKSWDNFNTAEKEMFGPNSAVWTGGNSYYNPASSWPNYPLCNSGDAFSKFPLLAIANNPPTSRQLCECWGGQWMKSTGQNFDNIIEALMVAFGVASTDGWTDVMNMAVDSNGIDMQPIVDNRKNWIVGFMFFIIFGSFLPLSMYIGVICSVYGNSVNKAEAEEDAAKSPEEVEESFRAFSLNIMTKNTNLRYQEFEAEQLQMITLSPYFRSFFTIVIALNAVLLACTWFGEDGNVQFVAQVINIVFSGLFTIEVILRIRDRGWSFFNTNSNKIDFAIVVLCDISDISAFFTDVSFSILKLIRLFRMMKILKLLKFESVLKILRVLIKIIPDFINVLLLLFCIIFIWAIIGNQTFAEVAYGGTYNEYSNFRSIPTAMLTLVKFLTGEGWAIFMYSASQRMPSCVDEPQYDPNMCGFNDKVGCKPLNGCGSRSIFPFMMTYIMFASFTVLNLTISVVVNAFHHEYNQKAAIVSKEYQRFCRCWLMYDTNMTCYLKPEILEQFVMDQQNPYAFPSTYSMKQLRDRLSHLGLKVIPGRGCLFEHVLTSLQFDYEVFGDRSDPIQIHDSVSDPNSFGLLQVYGSKDLRTELIRSIQSRKLIKQRRLTVKFAMDLSKAFFDKFYMSRAYLRWKHGDSYFDNVKVAGIWPRKITENFPFDISDIFSAKFYGISIFGEKPDLSNKNNDQSNLDTTIVNKANLSISLVDNVDQFSNSSEISVDNVILKRKKRKKP